MTAPNPEAFAPQIAENVSLHARMIVAQLRYYERRCSGLPCMATALREAECALGIGPKDEL